MSFLISKGRGFPYPMPQSSWIVYVGECSNIDLVGIRSPVS